MSEHALQLDLEPEEDDEEDDFETDDDGDGGEVVDLHASPQGLRLGVLATNSYSQDIIRRAQGHAMQPKREPPPGWPPKRMYSSYPPELKLPAEQ